MEDNKIKLDKVYRSEIIAEQSIIHYDNKCKKRPSWVKINLDKKIIFIKIIFYDETFWYRRYFKDYFFPLNFTSEDYKNYYDEIAEYYESYVPQNKKMGKIVLDIFKENNISKKSKILDLGAGTGFVTEAIVEEGYKNLTLLDISKNEVEIAKTKKSLKNCNFIIADITKEDIGSNYEVIFETMVIDYFKGDKMPEILKKIKNALTEKGKFIVIDRHIFQEFDDFS